MKADGIGLGMKAWERDYESYWDKAGDESLGT